MLEDVLVAARHLSSCLAVEFHSSVELYRYLSFFPFGHVCVVTQQTFFYSFIVVLNLVFDMVVLFIKWDGILFRGIMSLLPAHSSYYTWITTPRRNRSANFTHIWCCRCLCCKHSYYVHDYKSCWLLMRIDTGEVKEIDGLALRKCG